MKSRVAIVGVEGGLCEEEDWARREREGEKFFRSYWWRRRWGPLNRRRRRSRKDEGSKKEPGRDWVMRWMIEARERW
jgi:hypothetical protein